MRDHDAMRDEAGFKGKTREHKGHKWETTTPLWPTKGVKPDSPKYGMVTKVLYRQVRRCFRSFNVKADGRVGLARMYPVVWILTPDSTMTNSWGKGQ